MPTAHGAEGLWRVLGEVAALSASEKRLIGQLVVIGAMAVVLVVAMGSYADWVVLSGMLAMLALTGVAAAAFLRRNARERRRFIERFEDARARAESLGQQVKAMLGDLAAAEEEKMRRVVGLADGISHELRNPLAILNMGLDSLEAFRCPSGGSASDALLADMRDALARVGGSVHHLGALSNEHGKTEAEVDVNETIRGLAGVVQLNLRTSSAALSLDLSPSVAALWLPHQPVTLALFIILNAAAEQVHEAGGSIEVETRMHTEEDAVGIRVATSAPVLEEAPPSPLDTSSSGWKDPALDTAARIIESLGGCMRLSRQASGAKLCAVRLPGAVAPDSTRPDRDLDHSSS